MAVIDIEKLLKEVSADKPCGENLKHDVSFMELATAAKGKPEQVMGDSTIAAQDPDWKLVQKLSENLFSKTKDLRVAIFLITALLHNKGIPGFSAGLSLLHKLLDQYWDTVHPELDAEDNNDPTLRMNSLEVLNDPVVIIGILRKMPLVSMPRVGQFSLRDIEIASGKISPPADPSYVASNPALIEGVFRDCDVNELQAMYDAVEASLNTTDSINSLLKEKVGVQNSTDLDGLLKELKNIHVLLKSQLALRGAIEVDSNEEEGGKTGSVSQVSLAGEVNTRNDVIRLLDKICDYYQRNEPSSPVPMLLMRAKRLVNMNFMEIMEDLVSDAVKQAEKIVGVDKTK